MGGGDCHYYTVILNINQQEILREGFNFAHFKTEEFVSLNPGWFQTVSKELKQ